MIKGNENCPSYDCGFCNTYPTPYSVKCGGDETKKCKWLDYDFTANKVKKTNFDVLKELTPAEFAYAVALDNCGECRGVCAICQRHFDGDCDDKCISGIVDYLEREVTE